MLVRYLPIFFIVLGLLFAVLALKDIFRGEFRLTPQRRTWLLIAVIFTMVGVALLRFLQPQ